uniref:Peptidase_M13_N domain-containing protein n=1 Tax=Macrostomum lignano TaxID=282301 RepID=A0A1I8JQH6_9PLAT
MAADLQSPSTWSEMYAEPETQLRHSRIWEQGPAAAQPGHGTSIAENILAGILSFCCWLWSSPWLPPTAGGAGGGGGVSFLNRSASPCDNFYAFACGAAEQVMPINPAYRERTVSGELIRQNADKLEAASVSPIVRNSADSYERKLKTIFGTCIDDFRIERVRGALFADLLRRQFYVINGSVVGQFDLDARAALRRENLRSFGLLRVPGGAEPRLTEAEQQRKLLVADAEPGTVDNPNGVTARIENFVLDVMEIETALANHRPTVNTNSSAGTPLDRTPTSPAGPGNQISLTEMDSSYQPISGTLESGVQGSTRVAVQTADYLTRAMTYVGETIRLLHPVDYNRQLTVDPDYPMMDISINHWQNFKRLKQGSLLAHRQLTDQQGNSNPMWSERTRQSYVAKAQCVNFTYWDLTAGPYWVGNRSYYVDINPIISRTLRTAVAETDALRLVSKAYAGFEGARVRTPAAAWPSQQNAVFVHCLGTGEAEGQKRVPKWRTFCFTRDPLYSYIRGALGRLMPEDIHVNGVLSLIPEFQSAFSCPADSAMVKLGGCSPIFYT